MRITKMRITKMRIDESKIGWGLTEVQQDSFIFNSWTTRLKFPKLRPQVTL